MAFLPSAKKQKETSDPRYLIIFSSPKTGKTTALSQLKDCLIVDTEHGTRFITGYVAEANNYMDLYNIACELAANAANPQPGVPQFKYVALDTVTRLEDMALELGAYKYKQSPMGKNWEADGPKNGNDLLNLPKGAGYGYLRDAMDTIISWFEATGLNLIFVCHVKDKMITDKDGEMSVRAIDLTGKISNILSAKSDAIGFMNRDAEKKQVYIDFGTSGNSIVASARPEHLNGKKILLTEMNDNGEIISHWDEIYPSLKDKK